MLHKRLDLKVGFGCNNNCRFCVVADKRNQLNQTTAELKNAMIEGIKNKSTQITFTGGEPTIRPDLPELVSFAKEIGFIQIQIQTNGRMFYYKNFVKKMVNCGVTEVSPALHGHIPELHEYLTRSPGSFKQVVGGIKNIRRAGLYLATNTVITKSNYEFLPEIAELLIKLGVNQFQFAFVHAGGNAYSNFDNIVPLKSLVKPYVHKALDIAKKTKVNAMIEAFPYCFMNGYERFCSELYIPPTEIREPGKVTKNFTKIRIDEGKAKSADCKKCKYNLICEGPWKEYPEKRGWDEFIPVKGAQIKSTFSFSGD